MNGNLLEIINKRFDIDMKRANSCMEIAMMEAAINIEEGEYKCMLESGTDSDLDYVLEEAKEGFIGKVKAAIDKIIEAVKKFCKDVKDKVIKFFSKKETDEALDKIEKKVKLNPIFKNKKGEVKDNDAELSLIKKYKAKLQAIAAKIKGGNKAGDELEDAKNEFNKKHAAILAGTVTLTAAAIIALLKKRSSKIDNDINDAETSSLTIIESVRSAVDKTGDAESANELQQVAAELSRAAQLECNSVLNGVSGLMTSAKKLVSDTATPPQIPYNESVEDTTPEQEEPDETITESSDDNDSIDDLTSAFESLLS